MLLQSKAVATAAAEAATAVLTAMNANAVRVVLPMLFDAMNQKQKWQTKVGALQQLGALTKIAPAQMKAALPDIVPAVAGCFADAKPQVKVHLLTLQAASGVLLMSSSLSVLSFLNIQHVPEIIVRAESDHECMSHRRYLLCEDAYSWDANIKLKSSSSVCRVQPSRP